MKPRIPLLLLAAALAFSPAAFAQAKQPVETLPPPASADTAVILNPFVVNTEKDTGYSASSTLAGTRLNTPIADLGASISILTKDFLDDIGATSVNDALIYAVGMEAGGPGGNFSGATGGDITNASVQSDDSRNEPQGVTRARGLGSANLTRGFFATDIASDAYTLDRITINRGANAMLVGAGNAGGVIESGMLRANPLQNRNKVQFRYGDNDSTRTNVDFNRVLKRGVLAFRLAALDEDERYQQRPAFERKQRVSGSVGYNPFRTTNIHANFETGTTKANRPFTGMPFRSISDEWLAALAQGRATNNPLLYGYDWSYFDDPARNPNARTMDPNATNIPIYQQAGLIPVSVGQGQVFGGKVLVFNNANSKTPSTGFFATNPPTTTATTNQPANAIRNNVFDPLFNKDTAFDTYTFLETLNRAELPTFLYPGNLRPAGVKFQGFSNYDAFDWRNREIDETGRQNEGFNTGTVTLEQRAWQDRIGLEVSYYAQRYENRNRNAFFANGGNGNHIRIDPNVTLQNGLPNPNFGRPYTAFQQTADYNSIRQREARRATGFLRYDFRDLSRGWGKWVGQHTLTGLMEEQTRNVLNFGTRLTNTNGAQLADGAIPPTGFNNRPYFLVYLGDSVANGAPLKLNPIQINRLTDGFTAQTLIPLAPAGSAAQAVYGTEPNVLREILNNLDATREVVRSNAYALNSYWLDDLFVTTLGWRRDERYFASVRPTINGASPLVYGFNSTFKDAAGATQSLFPLPNLPPLTATGEKLSVSTVLRWPQRLVKLPEGTAASVFFNTSENFSPSGTRVKLDGSEIESPQGKTREVGFNLSLFHNKVIVRYNNFETKAVNGSARSPLVGTIQNNAVHQLNGQIAAAANTGRIDYKPQIQAVLDAVPGLTKAYNAYVDGNALDGTLAYHFTPLSGLSDTVDSVAKGHELELVVNPTSSWRISANVAQQETVVSNVQPGARAAMEALLPVWSAPSFANIPRSTENTLSYLTNLVVVPYRNILSSDGLASAEQRKYRANLVTNYTFRSTWLKGVGIGTGVRWQDKVGIGYVTTRDASGAIIIDRKKPFFAPGETNVDLFASYGRRVWKNIDWRVQLNVRNALGTDTLIPINAQYDGTVASYRVPPEKRIYLTNTFTF